MINEERVQYWDNNYRSVQQGDSIALPCAKYIDLFRGLNVLEIGPGQGRQAVWVWPLAKSYAIADISEAVLSDPVFPPEVKRFQIESYSDWFGERFEMVHFWYVLHHVLPDELRPFFEFVQRHVVPGGETMFNTPFLDAPEGAYKDDGMLTSKHTLQHVIEAVKGLFEWKMTDESLWRDSNGYIIQLRKPN